MNKTLGFSLIEILIVIAVVLTISRFVSTYRNMFPAQNNQNVLYQTQQSLSLWLIRARQLAVNTQKEVQLCGGHGCDGDWSEGVAIHVSNTLLDSHLFDMDVSIVWKGFPVHKTDITFLPNGLSSYQNGTFYICQSGRYCYIRLNQSGRFYSSPIFDDEQKAGEAVLC
mgnify:CR=1 FL=1